MRDPQAVEPNQANQSEYSQGKRDQTQSFGVEERNNHQCSKIVEHGERHQEDFERRWDTRAKHRQDGERENNISLQENDRAKATTKKFQYNLKESDRGLREEFENGDATIDVVLGDFSRRESEEVYNVIISVLAYKIDIGDDDYYDVYYVEGDKRDSYYFLYDFVDMEHDEIYQTYPGLFEGVDSADDMYE